MFTVIVSLPLDLAYLSQGLSDLFQLLLSVGVDCNNVIIKFS